MQMYSGEDHTGRSFEYYPDLQREGESGSVNKSNLNSKKDKTNIVKW